MATPVVIVTGTLGRPVTNIANLKGAEPMTPVAALGEPVVLVASGGEPVTLINEDGTVWVA